MSMGTRVLGSGGSCWAYLFMGIVGFDTALTFAQAQSRGNEFAEIGACNLNDLANSHRHPTA
ncbi:hypothetical protein AG1IA_03820 [Rhizoctonia solani AG-1 IA]|uniref:Uncharacterized protein n=1 Tax=Thanatephorus cucumeris (strain AG1-IA) TaxID=983506 RepID=L8X0K0_THACA|nr:hypothetical protein AG1IA_03820 [Rhizoctonia solani AG-1 IA]